jgi:hypothetical protein
LENEWYRFFKNDMLFASSIIFVGYSMYDLDIGRIVFADSSLSSKTHFIVRENPTREEVLTLQAFGTVHPIGIDGLAARILALSAEPAPERANFSLFCFKEEKPPEEQNARPTTTF